MGGAGEGTAWGSVLGGVRRPIGGSRSPGHSGNWAHRCCRTFSCYPFWSRHRRCGRGLLDLGIPEDRSRFYEEEVKKGRFLAVIDTEADLVQDAARIMRDNGAADVETH